MEITCEQFESCIDYLVSRSERLGDGWQRMTTAKSVVFASKESLQEAKMRLVHNVDAETELDDAGELSDEEDTCVDAAALCISTAQCSVKMVRYIYHVVYSTSYQVPVIYFNAYTLDGNLLSLDDVWSMVPEHFQARLKDERWTFITQQEHPLLGRPFFQLHPCKTASLMESLQCSSYSDHYICSWLSAIGSVIGLSIGAMYFLPAAQEQEPLQEKGTDT